MNILKGRAGFKMGNFIYYVMAYLFIIVFGFIRIPVFTTLFQPQALGAYAWCVALLAYFDIIFLSWTTTTLWRYIYQHEAGSFRELLLSLLPLIALVTSVAAILIALISIVFIKDHEKFWTLVLGFLTIMSQQLVAIYLLYLQSRKKIRGWCWTIVAQQAISFLLLLLFVGVFKLGVNSIFLGSLAFNVSFSVLKFFQYKRLFRFTSIKFSRNNRNAIATYSYIAILLNCCLMLLNNGDRFLISSLKGDAYLGLYAQSYSLASVGLYTAVQAFNTIIAPTYNQALVQEPSAEVNSRVLEVYMLLFTPVLVLLLLNAKAITKIVLAPAYQGYHAVFFWAAAGIYCYGLCHFLEVRLKFLNKAKTVLAILVIVAILNLMLNRMYLPITDVRVAAVISFVSYLLLLFVLLYYNRTFLTQLNIKSLCRDLFISSILFISFHLVLVQQQIIFLRPLAYLIIDFLAALLVYSSFLKKHVALITFFFKKIV